jgi:hypothetical protein
MSATPNLACPNCGLKLEYHVTIEMVDPPVGKIDTGYCVSCAQMFERIRETATFYDSSLWPPLCRLCRQPVAFAESTGGAEDSSAVFRCRHHPSERWTWVSGTERWTRAD